jgi:hypothetical protein
MGWLPPLDVPLEYWPVILILLGLAKLVRISWLRMGAAVAAALLLGVMIMEVAHFDFLEHNNFIVGGSGDRQDLVEPCDGGIRPHRLRLSRETPKLKSVKVRSTFCMRKEDITGVVRPQRRQKQR